MHEAEPCVAVMGQGDVGEIDGVGDVSVFEILRYFAGCHDCTLVLALLRGCAEVGDADYPLIDTD